MVMQKYSLTSSLTAIPAGATTHVKLGMEPEHYHNYKLSMKY
jgi:hypothetical protein